MSTTAWKIIALVLTVFAISQNLLIRDYGELNERLQSQLVKCIGA